MSNAEEPKDAPVTQPENGAEKKEEEKKHDVDYATEETAGVVSIRLEQEWGIWGLAEGAQVAQGRMPCLMSG